MAEGEQTTPSSCHTEDPPQGPSSRFTLRFRQQPGASLVSLSERDRKPINPPPVLQMMIDGFDPHSPVDLDEIRSTFWVVHCRLVATQSSAQDRNQDPSSLLIGTSVATPSVYEDDLIMGSTPFQVPLNQEETPSTESDPNISDSPFQTGQERKKENNQTPGCLFVFDDLCVFQSGEYRLQFRLMKMEAHALMYESTLAILDSINSEAFQIMTLEDHEQMQIGAR